MRPSCAPLQACAAYSFITIPSLSNIFNRLNLYLLSGQVALANQCLSQGESRSLSLSLCCLPTLLFLTVLLRPSADAFLKAAVSILPEVPRSISVEGKLRSSETFLLDFINNFLATLLVVPVTPIHLLSSKPERSSFLYPAEHSHMSRVCVRRTTQSTACSTWSVVCSTWSRITPGKTTVTPRYGCTPAPCPCWRPWARKHTSTPSLKVILHTRTFFIFIIKII